MDTSVATGTTTIITVIVGLMLMMMRFKATAGVDLTSAGQTTIDRTGDTEVRIVARGLWFHLSGVAAGGSMMTLAREITDV